MLGRVVGSHPPGDGFCTLSGERPPAGLWGPVRAGLLMRVLFLASCTLLINETVPVEGYGGRYFIEHAGLRVRCLTPADVVRAIRGLVVRGLVVDVIVRVRGMVVGQSQTVPKADLVASFIAVSIICDRSATCISMVCDRGAIVRSSCASSAIKVVIKVARDALTILGSDWCAIPRVGSTVGVL
jgi:hypothetical protein